MRKDARGMTIKDDYLARLLSLRWAPELSAYDALYKMSATLVRKSNAFAAVMYNEDFTKVKQIVPLTVSSFRIYEDDDGNILFRFTWDYDGKTYVLPYQSVIHIRARFSKKRFIGTPPDQAIQTTLELLDATGQALEKYREKFGKLKRLPEIQQLRRRRRTEKEGSGVSGGIHERRKRRRHRRP